MFSPPLPAPRIHLPAEGTPHAATWMQWPHHAASFGCTDLLTASRRHIARLACNIAEYECVVMLAHPDDAAVAQALCGPAIDVVAMPIDNMWARDSCPVFVLDQERGLAAVDFQFNGWGRKDTHALDATIARQVATRLGIPCINSGFVSEGGAWDTDGQGTFLTTESAVLNANRNPGATKTDIGALMTQHMGAERIIWIPGVKDADITDAHIDGIARFITPDVILIEEADPAINPVQAWCAQEAARVLASARDTRGQPYEVVYLRQATQLRSAAIDNPDFYSGYINHYVCNGAVMMPQFGDTKADRHARSVIADVYPGRKIVALDVDHICAYGGGIHCVTQQQPLV